MYGLFNVGSMTFGLMSLFIPIVLVIGNRISKNCSMKGIFFSLTSVMLSLLMQILYAKHLVDIEDWSALMDTQGAVALAALSLIIVTAVLNGILLQRSLKNRID